MSWQYRQHDVAVLPAAHLWLPSGLFEFAHRSARRVSMILSSTTHEWAVRYALPLTDVVKNRAPSEHAPAAAARFLPEA